MRSVLLSEDKVFAWQLHSLGLADAVPDPCIVDFSKLIVLRRCEIATARAHLIELFEVTQIDSPLAWLRNGPDVSDY